ncbi:MAG: hypothetical protein QXJ84_03425 [Desulfurococcaceae archaeon]
MKVALVYYSKTGNTELVVHVLRKALGERGLQVDVYRVRPVEEYSRPLHVNLKLLYDTIMRKGTDVLYEPERPRLEDYDVVIVASPVWYFTLAPPIQEFLKGCGSRRPLIVVTTSVLGVSPERIGEVVRELYGFKPLMSLNIRIPVLRDAEKLKEHVNYVVELLIEMKGKPVN